MISGNISQGGEGYLEGGQNGLPSGHALLLERGVCKGHWTCQDTTNERTTIRYENRAINRADMTNGMGIQIWYIPQGVQGRPRRGTAHSA